MSLKLRNRWKYIGNDWWEWEAFIDDGGSGELNNVKYVEYVLHPTFPNPVRKIESPEGGFPLKTAGWGTFHLKAFVHKKNKEKEKLVHNLRLEHDPAVGITE